MAPRGQPQFRLFGWGAVWNAGQWSGDLSELQKSRSPRSFPLLCSQYSATGLSLLVFTNHFCHPGHVLDLHEWRNDGVQVFTAHLFHLHIWHGSPDDVSARRVLSLSSRCAQRRMQRQTNPALAHANSLHCALGHVQSNNFARWSFNMRNVVCSLY